MTTIIAKLDLLIDYFDAEYSLSELVASSKKSKSKKINKTSKSKKSEVQILVDSVFNAVENLILSKQFEPYTENARRVSILNGGYSLYDTYFLETDAVSIKLIVDTRVSDHESRPNLKESNERRLETLKKVFPEIDKGSAVPALIDTYCKQNQKSLRIYIGGNVDYDKCVDTVESLIAILDARLNKFINKYTSTDGRDDD